MTRVDRSVRRFLVELAGVSLLVALLPGTGVSVPAQAAPLGSARSAAPDTDFNGDGHADLAVSGTDHVRVVYGSATGLTAGRSRSFTRQDLTAAPPAGDWETGFGLTLATGDFDDDGFCDLAIGDDSASIGDRREVGAVHVLYGSAAGLTVARSQYWTQASPGVPGSNEAGDRLGVSLAAGDLGRGDYADLAIGAPFETVGTREAAGAVTVLYGSPSGLTAAGSQIWSQDSDGVRNSVEKEDQFGRALTVGDFNGSGPADLAVGAPYETLGGVSGAGGVGILYGSADGLTAVGNQFLGQGTPGVEGRPEDEDAFGYTLTAGHFAGRAYADLAVFILNEVDATGAVQVLYGSAAGLTATGNQLFSGNTPGLPPTGENGRFGEPLTAANFGRDATGVAYDDLALGNGAYGGPPNESGSVLVLYGGPAGLQTAGHQSWSQDTPGVPGTGESFDAFGAGLAAADIGAPAGGPDYADLVIGTPQERIGRIEDAGRIHVLYGGEAGLSIAGLQVWNEAQFGGRLTRSAIFGTMVVTTGP